MFMDPILLTQQIMKQKQQSQELLSIQIGIPQSTLSRIATGKSSPTLRTYKKLLDYWQKINLIENGE